MVAGSSRDPDLAPFVGRAHLGSAFVVVPANERARLGFWTPMERDEAGETGLELLDPQRLGVHELHGRGAAEPEQWRVVLERGLSEAGVAPGRVGLAGRLRAGVVHAACRSLEAEGWRFLPAHELLLELRKTKSARELAEIRRVAAAATAAMAEVAAVLAAAEEDPGGLAYDGKPLTARRLRRRIAEVLAAHGVEQPEGNIVALGPKAGVPHTQGGSNVRLEPRQALIVDLFPRGGLFADCTRTFCVGEPPEALARAHAAVAEALAAARTAARPGISGYELHGAACERFERAGYPTVRSDPAALRGYVHGLGHGVGYELHELPSFRRSAAESGELAVGDVFTLEPGLYDPEAGYGVRLEDLCCLTSEGLEVLTPLPCELDPRRWPAGEG